MHRLKMAVVGVGALGRHHARILSGLENVELVAVADSNTAAATRVAADCKTEAVSDYRELFGRIDAACVAVPTFAHLPVASEFLKRKIPVLVEKPLASNVDQARELVSLSERFATTLQVGHVERFNPATQTAWKHCGPPKYIRAERVSPYPFRSTDISVVHDVMIHDLDLVLDLANSPIRSVEAFGISLLGANEDSVQARLSFENGCIADIAASRVHPAARRSMHIWSLSGAVSVDFGSREVVCYQPSETLLYGISPLERAKEPGADIEQLKKDMFGTYIKVHKPPVPAADALTAELASFVECVLHHRQPLVDGNVALEAMVVADRVLERVRAHQWDGDAAGAIGPFARTPDARRMAG